MTNTSATPSPDRASDAAPATDGLSRRSILRGVAGGGLALPLLAACGGGSNDAQSSDSGSAKSGPSRAGKGQVAKADVPVGGGIILTDQNIVVTQPTKGQFKAFSAICTHQQCPVNAVSGGQIICPCHGSHFSITDGSAVHGPAQDPLAAKKVKVTGSRITVS
jgi:nitrite reductase/ring-hydroxylating ferredoxin subunit